MFTAFALFILAFKVFPSRVSLPTAREVPLNATAPQTARRRPPRPPPAHLHLGAGRTDRTAFLRLDPRAFAWWWRAPVTISAWSVVGSWRRRPAAPPRCGLITRTSALHLWSVGFAPLPFPSSAPERSNQSQ